MAFNRPKLSDLRAQVEQDILSVTPGTGSLLRNSVLRVLGWAVAGLSYLHFGYLDYIAKQSVPITATEEYLAGWAALVGVNRILATQAAGTVTFTGSAGTIPANSPMRRADGVAFVTTAAATLASGTATVPAVSATYGSSANCLPGTALTLTTPVAGINSTGVVVSLDGAADDETDDALRTRMLLRFANTPQGGSAADYVLWALSIPGVTQAWCAPNGFGAGTVVVYLMTGGFPSGTAGVSSLETRPAPKATGALAPLADALCVLAPATAQVWVTAPTAMPVAVTISDLSLDTPTIRAQISAALTQMFVDRGSPLGTSIYESDIDAAISSVTGVARFRVTVPSSGIVTVPVGSLPTLGSVTYV